MIAMPSPSPTPRSDRACASAFERACISPKVSDPSSSISPTRSGALAARAANPPAGPVPHALIVVAIRASVAGEYGRMTPAPASTFRLVPAAAVRRMMLVINVGAPRRQAGDLGVTSRVADQSLLTDIVVV